MENEQLLQYVEKIERLKEEISGLNSDIRKVFADAKSNGFSAKAIREVIKLRAMDSADRQELDFELGEYRKMLGL